MAKYRVTEAQLQKIFEDLEMKRLSEMDNYNYPEGSDTKDAPWNQVDNKNKPGTYVPGNYVAIESKQGQYLLKDKQSNQLYYTINDVWEKYENGNNEDIFDVLQNYFEIEQEVDDEPDEDGYYGSSNVSGWKYDINDEEILEALASYMNWMTQNRKDLNVVDGEEWQDGDSKFLLVTPETISHVMDGELNAMARELLGLKQITK
jgi:hypothetical protein